MQQNFQNKLKRFRLVFSAILIAAFFIVYLFALGGNSLLGIQLGNNLVRLPVPAHNHIRSKPAEIKPSMHPYWIDRLEDQLAKEISRRRQERIDKVERLFADYNGGSALAGYESIFVDQAEKCGGDYRILVGIAGSESGLGRVMYKKYNPFGYLNKVQYPNQKTALTELTCKISQQHIARCGNDLNCLARRYGGPDTNLAHFISKVQWFADQVR